MISTNLEKIIHKAISVANSYEHEYATCEHLLLSLLSDKEVVRLLEYYKVDSKELTKSIERYLHEDLEKLVNHHCKHARPTTRFQRILHRAAIFEAKNKFITSLHLLAEFFFEQDAYAVSCLKEHNLTRQNILEYLEKNTAKRKPVGNLKLLDDSINSENSSSVATKPDVKQLARQGNTKVKNLELTEPLVKTTEQTQSQLETCCINLNVRASSGGIDCLVGRQKEVARTIEILCRRTKNNALLVGEPGVGKTAIAEGLAFRINNGDVPDALKNSVIYSLDIGSLVAGTKYRGDFEDRIKKLLIELKNNLSAILFIDEIHNIIGAGSTTTGALDASNLLKPALARGEVRCIGSTTFKEYHNHFQKDMALVRRFQKIVVTEPDEKAAIDILKGLKGYYESYHQVKYDDEALNAAVNLSERYINDRHLPDKAIDLIDEAGARKKILRQKEQQSASKPLSGHILQMVTAKDIEALVASISNVPNIAGAVDDIKQLQKLESNLKDSIFGQDEAITQLCSSIKLSRAGLRYTAGPMGCYLFVGHTGVGKTELARQLAKALSMELVKFDMSEYSQGYSVSRLVGSPPGYVGFNQGGALTDAVDKYPYSVVLFDEIEKAHPEVFNLLLQVMDEGKLTDATGKIVSFINSIIIFTTNLGMEVGSSNPIGFAGTDSKREHNILEAVNKTFSHEFKSRLDDIIVFNPLNENLVNMIINKHFEELAKQLAKRSVNIRVDKNVIEHLSRTSLSHENGARGLNRVVDVEVKQKIANEILFGKLQKGGKVVVTLNNNQSRLNFKFDDKSEDTAKAALEFS